MSTPSARSRTRIRAATASKYAAELAEKLRHVTDEFLLHENRDRPDALESILSPSLAPSVVPAKAGIQ